MRTKRVTIKDIATEAGVSIALVSFVMNNKADGKDTYRVNKETAQRILEVAQKLNYQPNNAARTLRSGKTNTSASSFRTSQTSFSPTLPGASRTMHINISIPCCLAARTKIRRSWRI